MRWLLVIILVCGCYGTQDDYETMTKDSYEFPTMAEVETTFIHHSK